MAITHVSETSSNGGYLGWIKETSLSQSKKHVIIPTTKQLNHYKYLVVLILKILEIQNKNDINRKRNQTINDKNK